MKPSPFPYEALLEEAHAAAREAARFHMLEFRNRSPGLGNEKAAHDFVSHVDVTSEAMIRKRLWTALPEAGFFGEESEKTMGERYTWIVDPLDGTTNFLSGFDHFSVSIALFDGTTPALGVVVKSATEESFTAVRGLGAFRNGVRLGNATPMEPERALVSTGTPYRSPDAAPSFWRTADRVMNACRDLRRTGSAALDLAYLAAGFFQGFFETDLQPYDVAAGLLFLSETGCAISDFGGMPYDPFSSRTMAAGFPGVHEAIVSIAGEEYGIR